MFYVDQVKKNKQEISQEEINRFGNCSNQDGDESDFSSLLGDDDGEHQAWMPRVSLNGDSDGDSDGDGDSDQVAV